MVHGDQVDVIVFVVVSLWQEMTVGRVKVLQAEDSLLCSVYNLLLGHVKFCKF